MNSEDHSIVSNTVIAAFKHQDFNKHEKSISETVNFTTLVS